MALTKREKNRRAFSAMIKERGLHQGDVAALLYVSLDTVKSWLKPETSKRSFPVPAWAPELLAFKKPPRVGDHMDVTRAEAKKRSQAKR
jgi:hypothetical protein